MSKLTNVKGPQVEIPTPDLRIKIDPRCLSWELFLFGEVEHQKIAELIQHIISIDQMDKEGTITLFICSPGGYCSAGYALIDIMQNLRHPVRTVVLGEAASMAALIAIAGSPKCRFMGSRSLMLFHPISDAIADYGPYIKDRVVSLKWSEEFGDELMTSRTNLPKDMIEKASNGELWLDSATALKYGVCDGIITDQDAVTNLYKKLKQHDTKKAKK